MVMILIMTMKMLKTLMIKNDDIDIWKLFSERTLDPYDAEGELPGPIAELDPDEEEEGCPNLERLINGEEDGEGKGIQALEIDDQAKEFDDLRHTPV